MQLDPVLVVGAIGTVATAVIGAGIRKVWVWGWVLADKERQLTEQKRETVYWRAIAMTAIGIGEKAVEKLPRR